MTAEQIHDALTLLPADLIAPTDELRRRPRKRTISWRPIAAAAACLALLLTLGWPLLRPKGGASQDAASAQAPNAMLEMDLAEFASEESDAGTGTIDLSQIQCLYLPSAASGSVPAPDTKVSSLSTAAVIRSSKELESALPPELLNDCRDYDGVWFETQDLILVVLSQVSEGFLPQVESVNRTQDGWEVVLSSLPASGEGRCFLLIPTAKNLIGPHEAVTVISKE